MYQKKKTKIMKLYDVLGVLFEVEGRTVYVEVVTFLGQILGPFKKTWALLFVHEWWNGLFSPLLFCLGSLNMSFSVPVNQ